MVQRFPVPQAAASPDAGPLIDAPVASATEPPPLGVYVHFPWCVKKCPYCDFLSVAVDRSKIDHSAYADAVCRELEQRRASLPEYQLRSIFFGGGTPSLWDPKALGQVLEAIRSGFGRREGELEVTVECNPGSFDENRAEALLSQGVNRVSIGVQSLDAQILQFLGRWHSAEQGLEAVRAAQAAGMPRVSADLIFAVAGQTPDAAVSEARTLAETGLTHLSAYALTIEPGTQFGALARKGRLPLLSESTAAESFSALDEALTQLGFSHYEISNYARSDHRSEHNLGYWRGHDYLGLGTAAWGTLRQRNGSRQRYRNTPSPERYLKAALSPGDFEQPPPRGVLHTLETIDPGTALSERIMLGLRLSEGVDIDEAARNLGVEPWPRERLNAKKRWLSRGCLVEKGSRLSIPKAHWLFSDGIIASLV